MDSEAINTNIDQIDSESQKLARKIRCLFNFDMYFMFFVPSFFIFLSTGYIAPLFIVAVVPVFLLIFISYFLLSGYGRKLKRIGQKELFSTFGKPLYLLMLMLFLVPIGGVGFAARGEYTKNPFPEMSRLSMVSSALESYQEEHGGEYPPPKNWVESLFPDGVPVRNINSGMNVVLNPNALELGQEKPDDMVLGFVCYSGQWGQVGVYDPDIHDVGVVIRYVTKWSSRSIRVDQSQYLYWGPQKPESPVKNNIAVMLVGVAFVVLIFIIICYRKYLVKHFWKMITIGFLSTVSGGLFCSWAKILYEGSNPGRFMSFDSLGSALGIIFSWGFVLWTADYKFKCKYEYCAGWVTVFGALVGIMCSCFLHIILMVHYKDYTIYPMLAGVPFGAWSGILLGWWTGSWFDKKHL